MYRGQPDNDDSSTAQDQGFSLRVTHRNRKTGLVETKDPYVLRVVGEGTSKARYWERPAGSGNLFDKSNKPVGRWDAKKPEGERFLKGAKHIEWTAPDTKEQKVAKALNAKDAQIAELQREIELIKQEKSKQQSKVAGSSGKE